MTMTVHLGFEVGTGEPVAIPVKHLCITGQTQESGKTTTLEALIARSGLRALAFVTKRGEGSFTEGRAIQPYFREQTDWKYVAAILEASRGEKLKWERAWIIRASKGARTLADVQANVREAMKKAKGQSESAYLCLDAYLDDVVPLIGQMKWAESIDLRAGLNVMELEALNVEMQHLVLRSSIEWMLNKEKHSLVVVPEAWKFIPQGRGTPVKLAAEAFVRQAAAMQSYLWLDSQDIAGVEKIILKSVPVWLLGVQRESNEIKRTLDQIPAGIKKPSAADIAMLELGQFFACWGTHVKKVYVQPAWMTVELAKVVAMGGCTETPRLERSTIIDRKVATVTIQSEDDMDQQERDRYEQEIAELKEQIHELHRRLNRELSENAGLQLAPEVKASPKMDQLSKHGTSLPENQIALILDRVFADSRMPRNGKVQVEAKEVVLKQYQELEVERILSEVSDFSRWQRDVLRYVEAKGGRHSRNAIFEAITGKTSSAAGGSYKPKTEEIDAVVSRGFLKLADGRIWPNLSVCIQSRLKLFDATGQEVEDVIGQVLLRLK